MRDRRKLILDSFSFGILSSLRHFSWHKSRCWEWIDIDMVAPDPDWRMDRLSNIIRIEGLWYTDCKLTGLALQ